ncbi:hypothetical protein QBC40DRAFT_273833 [Triangularia verruculosa]|uniref:Uncharacterized protein n=1 Tax=Triangularia verruculosa TaxID=2587418 RepID=A0AAN7AZB6_9PEZI|nr:hypothetical protein QBC40DRAFT_273833 [Triangularia verruculosa]
MTRENYHVIPLDNDTRGSKSRHSCSPLGLIKSFGRWWSHDSKRNISEPTAEKKYIHTPTHAASSFLKTTTTRGIQKANEIL